MLSKLTSKSLPIYRYPDDYDLVWNGSIDKPLSSVNESISTTQLCREQVYSGRRIIPRDKK